MVVFRPLAPLPFAEKEREQLIIRSGEEDWLDAEAHRIAEQETDTELSLEEIRADLARIPGSWADDVIAERGEH